jgi:hypothetical protein
MHFSRFVKATRLAGVAAIALIAAATSARATTLVRAGLDTLVAGNATIVLGEVVDAVSYWNDDHTFILTDVTLQPIETIKGRATEGIAGPLTLTLMGGTVGDLTTLILGGPDIGQVPGFP